MNPMKLNPSSNFRRILNSVAAAFAVSLTLGVGNSAFAASQTWNGGSPANGNWTNGANWVVGNAFPGLTDGNVSGSTATFNAAIGNTWGNSAANPVVIDSNKLSINSILFTATAGNYFIGSTNGNSLFLSNGGSVSINNALSAI